MRTENVEMSDFWDVSNVFFSPNGCIAEFRYVVSLQFLTC